MVYKWEARFKHSCISTLWESEIRDLAKLREHLPQSVLVGLNIKSFRDGGHLLATEVGLAVLRVTDQWPEFCHGRDSGFCLRDYYHHNKVEVLTIRLRPRQINKRLASWHPDGEPEKRFGEAVNADSDEKASDIAAAMLSKYEGSKILVGWSMRTDFEWILENCSSLAEIFSAWVDLQELVMHRRIQEGLGLKTPGMNNTLREMQVTYPGPKHHQTCPANDALRTLNVLSGLVHNVSMIQLPPSAPKVRALHRIPPLRTSRPFAAWVETEYRRRLPLISHEALRDRFSRYAGLKTVAVSWRTQREKAQGAFRWFVEFNSEESLNQFIKEVDGSIIDNVPLRIVCNILIQPSPTPSAAVPSSDTSASKSQAPTLQASTV